MRAALPALAGSVGFGALALLLLIAVSQPLVTDDAWLHLALGRAYAATGPWLDADPLLSSAPGPPTPAAWLFDVTLYGVERATGFAGIRLLHVALVMTIGALAWAALRRASGSLLGACLGTGVFAVLAAYRLVQIRPHLFSMLAALLVYRWLIAEEARPRRATVAGIALLMAVWANVHAAFLLGPLLVGAALVGLLVAAPLRASADRPIDLRRARTLAVAGAVGGLATLVNPAGARPHLAWFVAGAATPSLERVADEWRPVDPFAWPVPGLPPSPLAWALLWGLGLATLFAVATAVRSWRARPTTRPPTSAAPPVDPALVGLAILSIGLSLVAVRFLWLAIFPLLLVARAARGWLADRPRVAPALRWAAAVATLLLPPAFLRAGAWPMITPALSSSWAGYRQPYHAGKYHADLVWVLADAGLHGTAFTDYHMAGFTGYQLAPDVRTLVNGTLNVPRDVIDANLPLRLRRGARPGERFVDLLDRLGVDLFVGIRLPRAAPSGRPWFYTTGHLERTPGWIPIFRNLTGAIYLRDDARNRANLDRVAAWYAEQGIPFDAGHGFDPEAVVRADRSWATRRGVVPRDFDAIAQTAFGPDPVRRNLARDALASIYLALGLYERAIDLDRPRAGAGPDAAARRRLAWSLLRLHRIDDAVAVADAIDADPGADALSRRIADAAHRLAHETDDEKIAQQLATLPVFSGAETATLTAQLIRPAPRLSVR